MKIDLMRIDTLYNCYLFTVSTSAGLYYYPLLLFCYLFADTKLIWKTAYCAHFRTHLVTSTSNRITSGSTAVCY